ncbi:MAG: hypothetical protein ACJAXS_003280, partial [Colwellia sp.]
SRIPVSHKSKATFITCAQWRYLKFEWEELFI